jgi:tripartite-type tricarboxylate transporter receptor subunit TctC
VVRHRGADRHAAAEAIKSDEVVNSLKGQTVAVHGGTADDFARHLEAEHKRWTKVVETAGLRK